MFNEDDKCPVAECKGTMKYPFPVDNCTCHMGNPPCGQCVDNPLTCSECGIAEGDLTDREKGIFWETQHEKAEAEIETLKAKIVELRAYVENAPWKASYKTEREAKEAAKAKATRALELLRIIEWQISPDKMFLHCPVCQYSKEINEGHHAKNCHLAEAIAMLEVKR